MSDAARRPRPAASGITRRQTLIGGAFLATAAAGVAFQPRRNERLLGDAKLDALVPHAFAGWRFEPASGLVLPPADQLRDKIYSQLVTRVYSGPGKIPVMLLIAYSGTQDGTIQVHRPEVCYPASGYRLTTVAEYRTPLAAGVDVPSRYILAESDLRREQLVYWTRIGKHFPVRWSDQRRAVMAENFAGVIPDGVLVRLSTVAAGDGRALLDGFARDLYAASSARLRTVLVGRGLTPRTQLPAERTGLEQAQMRQAMTSKIVMTAGVAALLMLGACDKKAGGQVVAVVNGQEITQQELNAELGSMQVPAGEDKQVMAQLLQRVVDRKLAVSHATADGLDKLPLYLAQVRRAQDEILVSMLAQKLAKGQLVPDASATDRFIAANPSMFADRRRYALDQIVFPQAARRQS